LRGEPTRHPWLMLSVRPVRELAWWDWAARTLRRRFRLRDSLYGPTGAIHGPNKLHLGDRDRNPDQPALDVSFCPSPGRVATLWEWTNKEDGICAYDVERQQEIDLLVVGRTHFLRLALSPDGHHLAAIAHDDFDGSPSLTVWALGDDRPARGEC